MRSWHIYLVPNPRLTEKMRGKEFEAYLDAWFLGEMNVDCVWLSAIRPSNFFILFYFFVELALNIFQKLVTDKRLGNGLLAEINCVLKSIPIASATEINSRTGLTRIIDFSWFQFQLEQACKDWCQPARDLCNLRELIPRHPLQNAQTEINSWSLREWMRRHVQILSCENWPQLTGRYNWFCCTQAAGIDVNLQAARININHLNCAANSRGLRKLDINSRMHAHGLSLCSKLRELVYWDQFSQAAQFTRAEINSCGLRNRGQFCCATLKSILAACVESSTSREHASI